MRPFCKEFIVLMTHQAQYRFHYILVLTLILLTLMTIFVYQLMDLPSILKSHNIDATDPSYLDKEPQKTSSVSIADAKSWLKTSSFRIVLHIVSRIPLTLCEVSLIHLASIPHCHSQCERQNSELWNCLKIR